MQRADVTGFFDPQTSTISYILRDPASRACAILDSVLGFDIASGRTDTTGADALIAHVEAEGLETAWILETHAHADHLTAAPYLQARLGGRTGIGSRIGVVQAAFRDIYNLGENFPVDGSQFDRLFADGERFAVGGLDVEVLDTPGHTPACISYLCGDAVFVGDTLFMPDYGSARCDFPGGCARTLYRSVRRLLALPDETRMFLCHDYGPGGRDIVWETSVGEQRRSNLHLADGVDEETFVAMREERDAALSMPALILPAVQVNIRAGKPPAPEDNGISYLKMPLNGI